MIRRKIMGVVFMLVLGGSLSIASTQRGVAACIDDLCTHGYHTMNDYYLHSNDVSKCGVRNFYISPEFTSTQTGRIYYGALEWNDTNCMSLKRTTKTGSERIRIENATLGYNVQGITFFTTSLRDEYPKDDYYFTYIQLDTSNTGSGDLLQSITTHEVGHALGLTHVTEQKSVMYPYYDKGMFSSTLCDIDISNIRHVYC